MTITNPEGTNMSEPTDTIPVMLARMEGTLGNVLDKVTNLVIRVDRHETHIGQLQLAVQRLDLEAKASLATVASTAKALREAKESQDEVTRAEIAKESQAWSPVTKVFALTTFLSTVFGIITLLIR
jgi:hypothetical protein